MTVNEAAVISGSHHDRLQIMHKQLAVMCPDMMEGATLDSMRTGLFGSGSPAEIDQLVYQELSDILRKCRLESAVSGTTTDPTISKNLLACATATNLTESWRVDHTGADFKPHTANSDSGYACDFTKNLEWFRFTGAAGSVMLDRCPKYQSCGAKYPYWTNERVPAAVGVPYTIKAYGVFGECSDDFTIKMLIMRCSSSVNDIIYRQISEFYDSCSSAFCGAMSEPLPTTRQSKPTSESPVTEGKQLWAPLSA